MVMKNNAFVQLPVSEAADTPWDTFAAEPRHAVWRNFDASFKGILTSGGDKTYSHRTGRRAAHFKSARAGDKHDRSSLSPEFKTGETKFQYLLEALNGVTKEFSDIENENDDCDSDE